MEISYEVNRLRLPIGELPRSVERITQPFFLSNVLSLPLILERIGLTGQA